MKNGGISRKIKGLLQYWGGVLKKKFVKFVVQDLTSGGLLGVWGKWVKHAKYIYYPQREIFTHIDYTKNQYSADEYQQKYADSIDGMPIDRYTSCRDWHYKIWCIENGEFSKETWYKLMIVSLPRIYQNLLNEILN